MAEDLVFPRIIYRGHPDTLGQGLHAHPETGELVGETARAESQHDLDEKLTQGWRLTRELADGKKPAKADDKKAAK